MIIWDQNTYLDSIGMSIRTVRALQGAGIKTIGDATSKSDTTLLCIPKFGRKSLHELKRTIAAGPQPIPTQEDVLQLREELALWRGRYEGAIEAIKAVGLKLEGAA